MTEPAQPKRCPTCRQSKTAGEFYSGCSECKDCKRGRSRSNRAVQARKIAAFEAFADILLALADRAADQPSRSEGDSTAQAVA